MRTAEQSLLIPCAGECLVGVLARPEEGAPYSGIGVIIVVGGPQYRVGAHRQFVHLARQLAAAGHAALRFDVRGMGDSSGDARSFEGLDDDIAAAQQALLEALPQTDRVVLWGLCDGASAALMYCARRGAARLAALCLVNPWLRSEQSQARTQASHYYRRRLMEREFWVKLASGGVAGRALRELVANLRRALARPKTPAASGPSDFRHLMADGWQGFAGPILLVTCSDDFTAQEFLGSISMLPPWRGALEKSGVTRLDVKDADHTYSTPAARAAVEGGVLEWLAQLPRAAKC